MITNIRCLGVQIDSKLNWDKHIDTIKTKANRALGLIKYSKKYLPSDVLDEMYRGSVEPHLSYCCSVWGCCSKSKLDVLQKIQNRAARIVTGSPYDASAARSDNSESWMVNYQFFFHFFIHFKFFIHGGPINQEWLLFRGPWKKSNYNATKIKKNIYNVKLE